MGKGVPLHDVNYSCIYMTTELEVSLDASTFLHYMGGLVTASRLLLREAQKKLIRMWDSEKDDYRANQFPVIGFTADGLKPTGIVANKWYGINGIYESLNHVINVRSAAPFFRKQGNFIHHHTEPVQCCVGRILLKHKIS